MLRLLSCILLGIFLIGTAIAIIKLSLAIAGLCLLGAVAFMLLNHLINPN
jgi:hypothetical protein